MLRFWRARRRVSQMDLAHAAGVSTRHLSFVETGRSGASRELLGALAEELDIPLRERNALLLAAGYARPTPSALSTTTRSARSGTRWSNSSPRTTRTRHSSWTAGVTSNWPARPSRRSSTGWTRTHSGHR